MPAPTASCRAHEPSLAEDGVAADDWASAFATVARLAQLVVVAAGNVAAILAACWIGQAHVRKLAAQRQRDPLATNDLLVVGHRSRPVRKFLVRLLHVVLERNRPLLTFFQA